MEVPRENSVAFRDRVCSVAGGLPSRRMRFAGAACHQRYQVRRHECGIEADSKLTDHGRRSVRRFAFLHLLQQISGAGLRNGSDVRDHFFTAHPDSVVVDGESFRLRVAFNDDLVAIIFADQLRIAQRFKTKPVDRIGCVRDQLANEYFLVGI